MAYSSTNPPVQVWQTFGGGIKGWAYKSTHTVATVAGSSFFSDGYSRGMRAGDWCFVVDSGSTLAGQGFISAHSSGAGATFSSSLTTT